MSLYYITLYYAFNLFYTQSKKHDEYENKIHNNMYIYIKKQTEKKKKERQLIYTYFYYYYFFY